jgi:hypothetical protein
VHRTRIETWCAQQQVGSGSIQIIGSGSIQIIGIEEVVDRVCRVANQAVPRQRRPGHHEAPDAAGVLTFDLPVQQATCP